MRLSNSIDPHGLKVTHHNVANVFASGICNQLIVGDYVRCAHVLVYGVASEEWLDLDDSQVPHKFTGLCRH